MKSAPSYGQFCPVSMAAEIICSRWTVLILRELLAGSSRFNDLRRGLPRMSPSLLSKRLKELTEAGVIEARKRSEDGNVDYVLTPAGEDLRGIVMSMGFWGQRWVDTQQSLANLDPTLLMWDMRRNLDITPMPPRRTTVRFCFPDQPINRRFHWLVIHDGSVDLCSTDPGFEVDLYVESSLRSLTAVWMGLANVKGETEGGRMQLDGDQEVKQSMQQWLGLSPFAKEQNRRTGISSRAA